MGRTPTGRPGGNQGKPIEQKRLLGNPGKRALPPLAAPPAEGKLSTPGEPPRPLAPQGRALWDRCWRAGARWMDCAADVEAVLILCEQADERWQLRARVLREGDWRERAGLRALDAQIMAGISALGFTPADRSRLGIAEVGEVDELEAIRQRRMA